MKTYIKKVLVILIAIFVLLPFVKGVIHVGDTVVNQPSETINYNGYFSQPIINRYNQYKETSFVMYTTATLGLSVDTRLFLFPFFQQELAVVNTPLNFYDGVNDLNFYGTLVVKSSRRKITISGYDFITNSYLMGYELTWTDDANTFITLGGLL